MSGFLSPKFLKYRGASPAPTETIEHDLLCPHCGYNMRGLTRGRACPECGYATDESTVGGDVIADQGERQRGRWRAGLLIAALCVGTVLVARIGFFVASFTGVIPEKGLARAYVSLGALLSAAWFAAVVLVTPAVLGERWPWMEPLRRAARVLALGFPVGYACLLMEHWGGMSGSWLDAGGLLGRMAGAVGVMILALLLSHVAEHSELDAAARRLNAAVWLLWMPTALAQAFPATMAWFTLVPLAMVLFFWSWLMVGMTLGLATMQRHAVWATRTAEESAGRQTRIDAKRRAMEAASAASVRPVPRRDGGDISLTEGASSNE